MRLGLVFFFRRISLLPKQRLNQKGPLLLACNHPNSFLDAVILGAYFKYPVHFLARGDAFKNRFVNKILTALKAIPIYRLKEGKEFLALNDATFNKCIEILKDDGIILIFSEGLCINQWQLRSLKKGTARIALNAWKQNEIINTFKVLPVSFTYSSFKLFSKTLVIHFGDFIQKKDISGETEAEQIICFNKRLYKELEDGMLVGNEGEGAMPFVLNNVSSIKNKSINVVENLKKKQLVLQECIDTNTLLKLTADQQVSSNKEIVVDVISMIVLFIPAIAGYLIHLPVYLPVKLYIANKTKGSVFYHSALFGSLILLYPLYIIIITTITCIYTSYIAMTQMVFIPLLALVYCYWKNSYTRVYNFSRLTKMERKKLFDLIQG